MNDKKNLIIIKGEDKTLQIECCKSIAGKREVTFTNGKKYTYSYSNVIWLSSPEEINPEITAIYKDGIPISGIEKILKFDEKIKIFFKNGYIQMYDTNQLQMEETALNDREASKCFSYLKELAGRVSISFDDGISLLKKQYDYIKIINKNSVMSNYLICKDIKRNMNRELNPIFPFGFNISQKEAIEKSLHNQISIIEGPPGTGKTQTILNIIANAIINDKTVAVVSNNNSATANVVEKMNKYNMDFITAYLGNNDNKNEFFNSQTGKYPMSEEWNINDEEAGKIKDYLIKEQDKLSRKLEEKNRLSDLKKQISDEMIEEEYFKTYEIQNKCEIKGYKSFFRLTSDNIMSLLVEYKTCIKDNGRIRLKDKIRFFVKYGIVSFKFYKNPHENIADFLNQMFYKLKREELEKEIYSLEKCLEKYNFEEAMKLYSENSMKLLKKKLYRKYGKNGERKIFDGSILWRNFNEFIREYPVILSTTHSLRKCAAENYLFDYVIIDEASQVDIITGALALSCGKNAVIVGDLKQLPNVVTGEIKKISDNVFEKYSLKECYRYSENSILSSVSSLFENIPKTLLREHYRCSPKIIDFCNKKFYNDELIILTEENNSCEPLKVYKTVRGNHARGNFNQRQIDIILEEVIPKLEDDQSIGIISPYRDQCNELKKIVDNGNIQIDTVHKYQGREKDIVILSTVSNKINDFVDDSSIINVAVSRAVKQLIVVVSDDDSFNRNSNIGDLIKYIDYNNFDIVNSSVYSVFDLLYSSYSEKLLEFNKKHKKVSEYDSENIINVLIDKVLKMEEFNDLGKVMHQPLKMLVKDREKLSADELKYAMNILTHTDFLIYNKFNKLPVLVIEVDGYAFHEGNEKQLKRDKMKDEILRKIEVPILRLKTNGSGEEERIIDALRK